MPCRSQIAEPHDAEIPASRARMGKFELDLRAGELRADGETVRLQEQPFKILLMLLQRDGELVTREEICRQLWADGTIVDFDHSINTAIRKLRRALGDSADSPRYVQTIARRGYRLLTPALWLKCEPSGSNRFPTADQDARQLSQSSAPSPEVGNELDERDVSPLDCSDLGTLHQPRARLRGRQVVLVRTPELEQRLRLLEKLVYGRIRRPRGLARARSGGQVCSALPDAGK